MMKRALKISFYMACAFFTPFFLSSANAHPSSFYFSFGYPTYFSGSYSSGSLSYLYGYPSYYRTIFSKPVHMPNYQLTNQLAMEGETKKQIWLEALQKPLVQNPVSPPPEEITLEAPEIRTVNPEISQ